MAEWTEDKLKKLTQLLEKGLTRTEIGRHLGISRNAVAGKVNRMKSPEKKPVRRRPTPRKKHATATEIIDNMAAADLPLKFALRKIEWSRGKCSWPSGDPQSTEFNFCGKPVVQGKPYCNEHCFEAYTTGRELQEKQSAGNAAGNAVAAATANGAGASGSAGAETDTQSAVPEK